MNGTVEVRCEQGASIVEDKDLEKFLHRVMAAAGLGTGEVFVVGNMEPLYACRLVVAKRGLDRNLIKFSVGQGCNGDKNGEAWREWPQGGGG